VTKIEIINLALSDCGANLIGTVDDDLPEARQAKAKYNAHRDAVLECREWTFAKRRLQLNLDPTVPAFDYTYQYIIPSNVLRVVRVYNGSVAPVNGLYPQVDDWVREGWRVLTNETGPIFAEVLLRVDEGDFSPGMVLALSALLTSVFAIPLTENRQLARDFMDKYEVYLKEGGAMDGSQGRTQVLRPPPLPGRRQTL
jgi:hypothetical protein